MPNLMVDLAGLKLRNPTMLAAGVMGISSSLMRRVAKAGAAAVVTKSIGVEPRLGYSNPTVVAVRCGLINAMGLSNPGIRAFTNEIMLLKQFKVPVVASIFAGNSERFSQLAQYVEKAGANAIELNVSCPHVEGVSQICQDTSLLFKVVEAVKSVTSIPIITKLSPNVTDIVHVAKAAEEAGSDAVTAINTVRAMAIEIETGRPILANKIGGLSGPAIKPIAVRCVYEISRALKIPVIGCGGVTCWQDAIELLLAGAKAVQIGTAIKYKELGIFNEIVSGINKYLEDRGYRKVDEIVGLSHQY